MLACPTKLIIISRSPKSVVAKIEKLALVTGFPSRIGICQQIKIVTIRRVIVIVATSVAARTIHFVTIHNGQWNFPKADSTQTPGHVISIQQKKS